MPSVLFSFQIIKDFYLLGRGELFQAFIDTAQHMLKTPPSAVTEHGERQEVLVGGREGGWEFVLWLTSI